MNFHVFCDVLAFSSAIGFFVVMKWNAEENRRLRHENQLLREWQAKQTPRLADGPHRSAPLQRADGNCDICGTHYLQNCDCHLRPPRPEPTSTPSGGREQ